MRLSIVPLELVESNTLVRSWHRHHQPVQGHRFSIGVIDETGQIHGACIVGRQVGGHGQGTRSIAEVTRLVTDGTPNACSMLYAAAARASQALGFDRIQTYILESETGTSLKASGWEYEGKFGGMPWQHSKRPNRRTDQPAVPKGRWAKKLNADRPEVKFPDEGEALLSLWDAIEGQLDAELDEETAA